VTTGRISISRDSGYADRIRQFRIALDGQTIGTIGDGHDASFDVEAGPHTLRLGVDWARSNPVQFRVEPGETVRFTCASRARGSRVLLAAVYSTILSQRYIRLERAEP
jgi:hypothetical protein